MDSLQAEIDGLAPWFHNLHLPGGWQTVARHPLIWGDFPSDKWALVADAIPADLTGWKVLDVGCNAGFYTFELARRGAHVMGIDLSDHYLAQARWASRQYGLEDRTEFRRMQVYDLAKSGETFDLVWFMGVFYHLRYPMLGLDIVCQKVKKLLVFQTLCLPGDEILETPDDVDLLAREAMLDQGWPKMAFIEKKLANDPTNWWTPNRAGVEAMMRSAGMKVVARKPHEIFVCSPDEANPSCVATWNRAEFNAATGQAPRSQHGSPTSPQALHHD